MWHGLRSVLRMQLLEAIRAQGPLTVPQMSAIFDHECTGLYYHVKLLQNAGLIQVTRTSGAEAFAATGGSVKLKCNVKNPKEAKRLGSIVAGYVEASQKAVAADSNATNRGLALAGLRWENLENSEVSKIKGLQKKIHAILDGAKARRIAGRKPTQLHANWHVAVIAAPVHGTQYPITGIDCAG